MNTISDNELQKTRRKKIQKINQDARLNFRITNEKLDTFRSICEEQQTTPSEVINILIDKFLVGEINLIDDYKITHKLKKLD